MTAAAFSPSHATCSFVDPARAAQAAGAVYLSDLPQAELRWLWPGRIPLGRVTLLVSDPGLGKSLVALDIAARVSSGAPWPDAKRQDGSPTSHAEDIGREAGSDAQNSAFRNPHSAITTPGRGTETQDSSDAEHSSFGIRHSSFTTPGSVLLLTAEDDLADTVRPRIEALGGDCSRIVAFPAAIDAGEENPHGRNVDLRRDLARIAKLLDAMPSCRLLIVDPVNAYVGGGDVQGVLLPLSSIARERGLAVLAVSHFRKKEGAAIHRAVGSLTFVSAARAVWVISKDPAVAERRLMLPLKNNLMPNSTGLAYTIATSASNGSPVVEWSAEPVDASAEVLIGNAARPRGRQDDECRHAIAWLKERLSKAACPSLRIKEEAAVYGIAQRTLFRAFHQLGGEVVRMGFGPLGQWAWKLPGIDCQISEGDLWQSMSFLGDFSSWPPLMDTASGGDTLSPPQSTNSESIDPAGPVNCAERLS